MESGKASSAASSITNLVTKWKGAFQGKPLSVMDAAKRLDVPPQAIYDWLAQGKLKPASLTWGENEEGGKGQAFVIPVDQDLIKRWTEAGEAKPHASGSNGNGAAASNEAQPKSSAEVKAQPTAERVVERIIERPSLSDQDRMKYESEIGFLKGRIEEMEKSLSWERDARAKVEREIAILSNEKSKLEGQLALSTKVEKSLQKYTDKLEQDLKAERDKSSSK